jgi:hypothetical protein
MKSGTLRHIADIYAPISDTDTRGQIDPFSGTPYMANVPCSIEQLSSRELDAARQVYATATHEVKLYADPKRPIAHTYWLKWGNRRLEIGAAVLDTRGLEYTLTCGEVVA